MAANKTIRNTKSAAKYSKRPLWQWVTLYILVGGLVYWLIYWYVLRGSANQYGY